MMHFLGAMLEDEGLGRFARPLRDDEFAPLVVLGLPEGFVAWHVDGVGDPRMAHLYRTVPVVVDNLGRQVDPIVAILTVDPGLYDRWAELYQKNTH